MTGEAAIWQESPKTSDLRERLTDFMERRIYPNEPVFERQLDEVGRWQPPPIQEELKAEAKAAGLWNLFLPDSEHGAGLSNLEYAPLCEIMGRSPIAPEVFNCSAPTPATWKRWSASDRGAEAPVARPAARR